MANMKTLQDALNSDQTLKQKFLNDPGKVLQDHGVTVDDAQLQALKDQLKNKLGTGQNPNAISVGVTVGN